jgi:hypothetical protein
MLPYLIAGAIGFAVAKLFEEDETPKYDEGGQVTNYTEFYNNLQIEDGSQYVGQKFSEVFPFLYRRKTPHDFRLRVKQYYGIVNRLAEDNYSTKAMKQMDVNKLKKLEINFDKTEYLASFYLDSNGIINKFVGSNPNIRLDDGGIVQPKDLTKINNFKNIQIGVDYYAYSDDIEKQNKSDRWYELFVKNQKHKKITPKEFKEFISLSNELAWEDLGDSNSDGYKSGGSVNVIDVKQYNIGRRNYRFVEIAQKNNNKIELYRQANNGKYYGTLLYREVPRYTPQFESTMVNDLNQLYAYEPVSQIELLNAVINKTKPFASIVYFLSYYEEVEIEKEIAGYISQCEKYDLDYSVNRINDEDGLGRIAFAVCQKGTFDELFDIDALLGDYFTNDFDLHSVKKIIEFRDKELSHFLNNDWDDNYALTGLILGIPPKFTMSLINMGTTYRLGKEYKYDNEVIIVNQ